MGLKVGVTGSRHCGNFDFMRIVERLPENCTLVLTGGAEGVDRCAREAARHLGIPHLAILPDYGTYGKSAPLRRNTEIVEKSDLVLAFWDYSSRGTADTIAQCIRLRVPVRIFSLEEEELQKGGIDG